MKHLTRDFLTLPSASCPGTNMYALAIFLIGCGGYTISGHTNFNLISGTVEVNHGISASINMVGGPTDVYLPSGTYMVSDADVNRILVLKSQLYPRANSGLFRVTAANPVNNTLTIDYRASSDPPAEEYLSWYLYVDEYTASLGWQSGSNGQPGYGSVSYSEIVSASASRIILRSPDPTSWQVRLCLESAQDFSGACPSGFSIAPGYGGTATGDFFELPHGSGPGADQKLHLHTALYYNTTESKYRGMVVGLTPALTGVGVGSPLWANGQWRISMIVDDWSGSAGIINRNVSLPVPSSGSGWACFGLCENEQRPPREFEVSDPAWNCPRLFVVGSSNPQSNLTWRSQFHADNVMQVVGFSKRGYPVPGVLSCYSDISNPSNSHVRYLTSSRESAWMSTASELFDVEVLVGTVDQTLSASTAETVFPLQPRRLGRLPFFRQGRAFYPQWNTTTESSSPAYYHSLDGVFMEWGGPTPTDSTSGSAYIATSGSVEEHEGVREYGAFLPGSDPVPDPSSPFVHDIDSTRFRKTYSYYRQVPVPVGVLKGGSNPPKP